MSRVGARCATTFASHLCLWLSRGVVRRGGEGRGQLFGRSSLHFAAYHGQTDAVRVLVQLGTPLNVTSSPLRWTGASISWISCLWHDAGGRVRAAPARSRKLSLSRCRLCPVVPPFLAFSCFPGLVGDHARFVRHVMLLVLHAPCAGDRPQPCTMRRSAATTKP